VRSNQLIHITFDVWSRRRRESVYLLSAGWQFLNLKPRQQVVTTVDGTCAATDSTHAHYTHSSISLSSVYCNWGATPTLPPFRGFLVEFPSRKAITRVQTLSIVDISRNSNGHLSVVRDAIVTWLCMLLVIHVLCMLMWPWPYHSRGQGHGAFELPIIAHNCTFLRLSPPPLSRGARNWWLTVIAWDLIYSLSEPDFWISFNESYHESSNFAECRYITKFKRSYFDSDATVTQLHTPVSISFVYCKRGATHALHSHTHKPSLNEPINGKGLTGQAWTGFLGTKDLPVFYVRQVALLVFQELELQLKSSLDIFYAL